MAELRSQRVAPTLITLVVVSLLLMTVDIRASGGGVPGLLRGGAQELIGPVQRVVAAVVTPVADFVDGLAGIAGLREENARLLQQLAESQAQLASMEELQARLGVLEDLYDLKLETAELVQTPANVIGEVDAFDHSFRIARGSGDGVLVNHPVIDTQGYLIGRVAEVTDHFAVVVPVIASDQAVTVSIGDQVGTLVSQAGRNQMSLEVFEASAPVVEGTEVVTSAQSSNYPPGIPVGWVVESVRPDGNALIVGVQPYASVSSLRVVVVLTWPIEETPTAVETPVEGASG